MITPHTYGHSGFTSSAYYYFGIANNSSKLAQGGPVVEASWLAAFQNTFSFPLSNLKARRVDVYSNIRTTNRFNPPSVGTEGVVPLLVRTLYIAPTDPAWVPYA
jgi:hypothetical protein